MKCLKCNVEMHRVDLEQVSGSDILVTFECPACHCRVQKPASR